jgi:hypothetical protein
MLRTAPSLAPRLLRLSWQMVLVGLLAAPSAAAATTGFNPGSLVYFTPASHHNVSFDRRSPIIDGKPTLLLSGAVHYTRVHEGEWGRVFDLAVEMGLNTIQTYVFWCDRPPHR